MNKLSFLCLCCLYSNLLFSQETSQKKQLQNQIVQYFQQNNQQINSNPQATHTIVLDFCGSSLTDTQFEKDWGKGKIIPPYNVDNLPYSFNKSELNNILLAFKMVAEDYAPFDVNITIKPPQEKKSGHYQTAMIGGYFFKISGMKGERNERGDFQSVKGLSTYNTFGKKEHPTLIFTQDAGGFFKGKVIGNAISHELGHSLGLNHDGIFGTQIRSPYYRLPTSWAPIMGGASNPQITQWCKGGYPDYKLVCARTNQPLINVEDDIAIIAKTLGYRQDDYASTLSNATEMSFKNNQIYFKGIIGREVNGSPDVDYIKFTIDQNCSIVLSVFGETNITNLNVQTTILNIQNQPIESYKAEKETDYGIQKKRIKLSAGTYYLKIEGVGKNNLFDAYGSLGQYQAIIKKNKQ